MATTTAVKRSLELLEQDIKEMYDPATAFGNAALIYTASDAGRIKKLLDETDECGSCDATGFIPHDCDCEHCEYQEDCEWCDGTGRIAKST